RRRHTRFARDWSSDVCSSDLAATPGWCAAPRWSPRCPSARPRRRCPASRRAHREGSDRLGSADAESAALAAELSFAAQWTVRMDALRATVRVAFPLLGRRAFALECLPESVLHVIGTGLRFSHRDLHAG